VIIWIGIGSFYNELTLAILYRVVDTYDDREHCSWEQNDDSWAQGVRFW